MRSKKTQDDGFLSDFYSAGKQKGRRGGAVGAGA